jgi:hypothetical protein
MVAPPGGRPPPSPAEQSDGGGAGAVVGAEPGAGTGTAGRARGAVEAGAQDSRVGAQVAGTEAVRARVCMSG